MPEVTIEYSNAVFYPGYEVTGFVVINTTEALRADSLQMTILGEARTYWKSSDPMASSARPSHFSSVSFEGCVPYVSGSTVLWNPPAGVIHVGTHRFPFRFLLPPNCAGSFHGQFGYIRYCCTAQIVRPWYKADQKTENPFTVSTPMDLNFIPNTGLPIQITQSQNATFMFMNRGTLQMVVTLPRRGGVPGESIAVETDIINGTSHRVKKIEFKILQYTHYYAYRQHSVMMSVNPLRALGFPNGQSKREEEREVITSEEEIDIAAGATEKVTRHVPIPHCMSTLENCPIIRVEYYLQVKLTTSGFAKTVIAAQLPFIIGDIPLRSVPPPVSMDQPVPLSCPPSYDQCVSGVDHADNQTDRSPHDDLQATQAFYPSIKPSAPEMYE